MRGTRQWLFDLIECDYHGHRVLFDIAKIGIFEYLYFWVLDCRYVKLGYSQFG